MKWYKSEQGVFKKNPSVTSGEGPGYAHGIPVEKTMGILSGNQKALYWYGMKLWVDDNDVIIRGPDLLIGLEFSKVSKIPYAVWWDIASSVNRGVTIMNNESLSPAERAAQKQYEDAKIRLNKAVEAWGQSRYK